MAHVGRQSAIPAKAQNFSEEFDIVIVGGGGVGLASACFAAWLGNKVLVLEKADQLGGTTMKAAFWYWVPNNKPMQAMGIEDKKEDCLRYMARLSRPEAYDPDRSALRHDASGNTTPTRRSTTTPRRRPSCSPRRARSNTATATSCRTTGPSCPRTRRRRAASCCPRTRCDTMSDGGEVADPHDVGEAARKAGVDIRTGHRVQRVIVDDSGRGRSASRPTPPTARRSRIKARKAVIFATGGFTHDVELRKNFLTAPVFGGCAARDQRGRLRPHRHRGRRRAAQHELRLDVPDRSGEGAEQRPDADRHLLAVRRLDDLRRQDRHARHQREARLQRIGAGLLQVGSGDSRNIRTWCSSRSGTSAARRIRRATSMAASSCPKGTDDSPRHQGRDAGRAGRRTSRARVKKYASRSAT